jgi:hypothetical protein
MTELWARMGEMGDEDKNNVEDTSGYEKSEEQLACWGEKNAYQCY